jgi:hypothetical protein
MGLVASVFSLTERNGKRRKSPADMMSAGTTAQPSGQQSARLVVSTKISPAGSALPRVLLRLKSRVKDE